MTGPPATLRICFVGMRPYVLVFCLIAPLGCRSVSIWHAPEFATPRDTYIQQSSRIPFFQQTLYRPEIPNGQFSGTIEAAEQSYAMGRQLEADGSSACVDYYLQATVFSWPIVEQSIQAGGNSSTGNRAWKLYHSSLAKLITTGQQWGSLDPRRGLAVSAPHGPSMIGVRYADFPWSPDDFNNLILVGEYASDKLTNIHRRAGLGVPVVVLTANHKSSRWRGPEQAFAATALLRPGRYSGNASSTGVTTLELVDPLCVSHMPIDGRLMPLAHDITAPIAYRLIFGERDSLRGFVQQWSSDSDTRLYMIEPYQPGKIPLVFVHGLLSDPSTWSDMANELRAQPDIIARYQLWTYEYPTGQAFLRSAAALRQQLYAARNELDPARQDPALDQMVLIGHSMGGLVSKLQVTNSGSTLWDSVANEPLETIRTTTATRNDLARLFFFHPLPQVKRVVFVGTPHRGSPWARRMAGRLGSAFVSQPPERVTQHRQLVDDNPGVFSTEVRRRIPDSLDLLEPDSALLKAIESLPISSCVQAHSIIGTGRRMLGSGLADGVVPVDSARHTGLSEKFVDARHRELRRHPDSIAEIVRILREHAVVAH